MKTWLVVVRVREKMELQSVTFLSMWVHVLEALWHDAEALDSRDLPSGRQNAGRLNVEQIL